MSLVHRAWVEPAQCLLWQTLNVRTEREGRRILASPVFGKYVVVKLEIFGPVGAENGKALSPFTATEILSRLVVVDELKLLAFTGVNALRAETLHCAGLRSLKTLNLTAIEFLDAPTLDTLPPLRITYLALNEVYSDTPAPILSLLGPSLTHLSLWQNLLPVFESVVDSLLSIAPQLLSLEIKRSQKSDSGWNLDPLISSVTNLTNLDTETNLFTLLHITTTLSSETALSSLAFSPTSRTEIGECIGVLEKVLRLECTRKLERLILPSFQRQDFVEIQDLGHKVGEWEKRKVKVVFQGERG